MDSEERVDSALIQLVESFVPPLPGEDEEETEDRQDDILDQMRATIER